MTRKNTLINKEDSKIIQFEQNGEFFHRLAQTKLDKNKYVDALAYYRRALEKDPENTEYCLSMAEIFTEMGCFEESNKILLYLAHTDKKYTECFFGMGCNFVGLQEYDKACDSFKKYLSLDPNGEFTEDAYDILDVLEDQEIMEESLLGEADLGSEEDYELALKGKEALDNGEIDKAVSLLETACEKIPKLLFARNNLSLAYYCKNEIDKAIRTAEQVLLEYPSDIYASCNLAIYYFDTKNEAKLSSMLEIIRECQTLDEDELSKISLTLHELGNYEEAYKTLKKLLKITPYDFLAMHQLGVCCYKLGKYSEAEHYYNIILKIDPNNTVARYYKGICRDAAAGMPPRGGLQFHFQVPHDETISRIRFLNDCIKMKPEEIKKIWQKDEQLLSLVKWGLDMPDLIVKRAMINLAAAFADKKVEALLRDFVMDRRQPDEVKREAFGLLKQIGAREPYFAYLDGNFVEVKVNLFEGFGDSLPESYRDVMSILIRNIKQEHSDCMVKAVYIWESYVKKLGGILPPLKEDDIKAFAAALEYVSCKQLDISVTKAHFCKVYNITSARFNTALKKLSEVIKK